MVERKFERITTKAGLSHNNVWSIIQDTEGFMWILTEAGLNRYDGYNFRKFENNPDDLTSIQKLNLTTMGEDSDGLLWFGSRQGILIHFDKQKETFSHIDLNLEAKGTNKRFHNDWIIKIYEYKQGNLFICTGHNGLQVFNKSDHSCVNYFNGKIPCDHPLTYCPVTTIILTEDNMLWLSTFRFGIYRYDIIKNELVNYVNDPEDKKSLCNNGVYGLFEDSKKNIWAITYTGLNLFDKEKNNFIVFKNDRSDPKSISNNFIHTISETDYNDIWIGTYGGLNKYEDDGTFSKYNFDVYNKNSISSNSINCLFKDRTNVLWIGTDGAGLNKLDCGYKKFNSLSKFNSKQSSKQNLNESIGSVYIDSLSDLLVGVRSYDGLFKYSKNEKGELIYKNYLNITENLKDNYIIHIVQESESVYWLCSYFGDLIEYNREKESFRVYERTGEYFYYSICIIKNYLYIAVNKYALLKFDLSERRYVDLIQDCGVLKELPTGSVFCLYNDIHNNLWIGYHLKGLFKFDTERNTITLYKHDASNSSTISNDTIMCLNNDSKGNLWIGTDLGGLCKYNYSDETFKRFSRKNGIPKRVTGILEDNSGYLWLRADDGLYKFDPAKESALHFECDFNLQRFDFGENTCIRDKEGILYFGGIDGITYFKPEEIKDNSYIPNVVITDFLIFNESVKPSSENPFLKKSITHTDEIILSHRESVFSFEFAALIYNNSSNNQYAYMMEGFDKDWVYCGTKREATYTNLNPGEYVFRVKASNNDGIWNEEGTSIKITITPPYWKTWWFKSLGIFSLLAASGLSYKKRINKLTKEKSAQEEFSKKLLNSQEEERKKIASVLHDSIAHDVLITKNSSEIGLRSAGENEEVKEMFSKISEQSSSTLNELRRIQFNLHPYEVEKLGLTKAIKSIVDRVSKSTEIKFTFEEDFIDKVFSEENEIHLYRIIQEAVNNIIKHSSATEAIIKINRTDENVLITISDNGKGFSKSQALKKNSMGLSGISERVKLLRGNLEIDSDRGTVLKISLPVSDLRF